MSSCDGDTPWPSKAVPVAPPTSPPMPAPTTPPSGNGAVQRAATHSAEPETLIPDLLDLVLERGASDLHLTAGAPPVLRLLGDLVRLDEYPVLAPQSLRTMIYAIISQRQRERLE